MQRPLIAWFAILAIALNALWPLIATAAPTALDTTVCTTVKAAQDADKAPLKRVPGGSSLPHCPFCPGVSDTTPAPTSAPFIFYERAVATLAAVIAGTAASTFYIYPKSAPRGPPAVR